MRRQAAALVVVLALGACAGEEAGPAADSSADAPADAAGGDEATPTALSTDDPAVQDAIVLTAIDEVLAPTRFADLVDEDPGAFLEAAVTLCAALGDDEDVDAVLRGFLTTLGEEGLELDDDTAYLGGALLGASVTVQCPEHEAALTEVLP